jgi:hypothetical protein
MQLVDKLKCLTLVNEFRALSKRSMGGIMHINLTVCASSGGVFGFFSDHV